MKQISLFMVMILLVLVGCQSEEKQSDEGLNQELVLKESESKDNFVDLEENSNQARSTKEINVMDFGVKANDSTFDNTPMIQAAIDSAQPGETVYIPEGVYYLKSASLFSSSYVSHLVMKSEVNIKGAGQDKTILISAYDDDTNEKHKTAVILARTVSNLNISELTVSSDTSDDSLPDPDVSNLNHFVASAPVYGIVVDNDKPTEAHGDILIENVLVEKFQRMGIRIRVVNHVTVRGCTIQKATDLGGGGAGYGISIQGMGNGADLTGSNLDATENLVEDCTILGPYIRHGILLQYYAHHNLVTNNRIQDTLLDAIDLHGEDEYANEISYNTIINTRRGAGIGLGNSGATHDATGPDNYIHHNEIIGGDRGIDVLYGTENTRIYGNSIRDIDNGDATGIFVQNGHGTLIEGNEITNFTGAESLGIQVLYSYQALEPEKGIPDGIHIQDNHLNGLASGIYVEAHTPNYLYENNRLTQIVNEDYIDGTEAFELPPISDVVIPRTGDVLLPTDDNFITNEGRDFVQTQANMKFKSSYFDVPYNRMIYMKFDLSDIQTTKEKVYLRMTSKSKDGLATINIYGTSSYNDWSEDTITWNKAKYHQDQVAKVIDPDGDLDHVTDFTYTTVGTEFNTYYIDVTDYIQSLEENYVTFILSNDEVENMYCEIYSKETSQDNQKLALVFSDH